MPDELVNVRYMVDDVEDAVAFYTNHFGFTLRSSAAPAFADVVRGNLRLLLSGPTSSAGRPMPDGRTPGPGRLEPHPLHRRGHRGRRRAAAGRGPDVPQRHHQRAGRPADPARGSLRQPDRALPAGGRMASGVRTDDQADQVRRARPPASAPAPTPGLRLVLREWGHSGVHRVRGPPAHIELDRAGAHPEGPGCRDGSGDRSCALQSRLRECPPSSSRRQALGQRDAFLPRAFSRWAVLGLNQRPPACEAGAP